MKHATNSSYHTLRSGIPTDSSTRRKPFSNILFSGSSSQALARFDIISSNLLQGLLFGPNRGGALRRVCQCRCWHSDCRRWC